MFFDDFRENRNQLILSNLQGIKSRQKQPQEMFLKISQNSQKNTCVGVSF